MKSGNGEWKERSSNNLPVGCDTYMKDPIYICHHCGKFLCEENAFFLHKDFLYKGVNSLEDTVHCEDHYHPKIRWPIVLLSYPGLVFMIIGITLFYINFDVWNIRYYLISLGIGLIPTGMVLYIILNHNLISKVLADKNLERSLALLPDLLVTVFEKFNIHIDYVVPIEESEIYITDALGKVEITAYFSPKEINKIRVYEKKHFFSPKKVFLGFFRMVNPSNIEFLTKNDWTTYRANPILMNIGSIEELKDLCNREGYMKIEESYKIMYKNFLSERDYPLVIEPRYGVRDKTTLELHIKLNKKFKEGLLKRFEIQVPEELISADIVMVDGIQGGMYDPHTRKVVWSKIGLKDKERILSVKFRESLDLTAFIYCTFELRINDTTISGFDIDKIWDPNGYLSTEKNNREVNLNRYVLIKGDMRIDPRALKIQEEYTKNIDYEVRGLIPDIYTVSQIINALHNSGVYVKRVRESPSQVSKRTANVRIRYWDILGRKYELSRGIYGVDYHILISGEEIYSEDVTPTNGVAKIVITARAPILENSDMNDIIDKGCKEVCESIKSILSSFKHPYLLRAKKRLMEKKRSLESRIEKLEEMFIEERISKDEYERLKSKYLRQIKEISQNLEDEVK